MKVMKIKLHIGIFGAAHLYIVDQTNSEHIIKSPVRSRQSSDEHACVHFISQTRDTYLNFTCSLVVHSQSAVHVQAL